MRFLRVLLAAAVATCAPAFAADAWAPAQRLDAYFDALERENLANGSIAISENGTLRYERALGSAIIAPAGNEAAHSGTRYRVGSITKVFTAVLAMQLAQEARLTLDNKIAEFFPDVPNALDVSYRHLLRHRSGLANYSESPDFGDWRTRPQTRDAMLQRIAAGGTRFPPGERVDLNNTNYLLLGYALEKIYERPYAQIVRTRIADRIGLARTHYAGSAERSRHESRPYELTPSGWVPVAETDPDIHGAAGGMVSTPTDLVRFVDALFAGRLVSAQSLATMRDQTGGSGIGLWPYTIAGQTGLGHGGAIDGFRACVFHFAEKKLTVAYASNAQVLRMSEIVDAVMSALLVRGHALPAYSTEKLDARKQAPYLGRWRSAAGRPEKTHFREFKSPDRPIELVLSAGADAPIARVQGTDFPLVAFGDHEFLIRQAGYLLRFDPRRDELVVRDGDWAYYLKRAE